MATAEIDAKHLLDIAGEDRGLLKEIVKDFEKDALRLLCEMEKTLIESTDVESVESIRRSLHQLKGSSGSLGMISFHGVIVELEARPTGMWANGYDWQELVSHLLESVKLSLDIL